MMNVYIYDSCKGKPTQEGANCIHCNNRNRQGKRKRDFFVRGGHEAEVRAGLCLNSTGPWRPARARESEAHATRRSTLRTCGPRVCAGEGDVVPQLTVLTVTRSSLSAPRSLAPWRPRRGTGHCAPGGPGPWPHARHTPRFRSRAAGQAGGRVKRKVGKHQKEPRGKCKGTRVRVGPSLRHCTFFRCLIHIKAQPPNHFGVFFSPPLDSHASPSSSSSSTSRDGPLYLFLTAITSFFRASSIHLLTHSRTHAHTQSGTCSPFLLWIADLSPAAYSTRPNDTIHPSPSTDRPSSLLPLSAGLVGLTLAVEDRVVVDAGHQDVALWVVVVGVMVLTGGLLVSRAVSSALAGTRESTGPWSAKTGARLTFSAMHCTIPERYELTPLLCRKALWWWCDWK